MDYKRIAKWVALGTFVFFLLGIAGMVLDISARSAAISRGESKLDPDGSSRIFSPFGVGLFLVSACMTLLLMAVLAIVGGLAILKGGPGATARLETDVDEGALDARAGPLPPGGAETSIAASVPVRPPANASPMVSTMVPAVRSADVSEAAMRARRVSGVDRTIEPALAEAAVPAVGNTGRQRPGARSAQAPGDSVSRRDLQDQAAVKARTRLLLHEPFAIDFDGRSRVRTFLADIRQNFEVDLKVHVGFSNGNFADENATLASIRSESADRPPMVASVRRGMSVGEFEQAIRDGFGFKVQVIKQGERAELDQPMMDEVAASRFGIRGTSGEVGRVIIASLGDQRVEVIKLLHGIFGLDLREAMNLVAAIEQRPVALPPVRLDAVEWLVLKLRSIGVGLSWEVSADGRHWQDGEGSGLLPTLVRRELSFDGQTACRAFRESIARDFGVGLKVHVGFSNGHFADEGATLASVRSESAGNVPMRMAVWPSMTVAQFEEVVREGFGFKVQVLRDGSRLDGEEMLVEVPLAPILGIARRKPSKFDVYLEDAGVKKIEVIKVVREATGLDLSEARSLVDSAPSLVRSCDAESANALVSALRGTGARASIRA